jgi:hypothetical protein
VSVEVVLVLLQGEDNNKSYDLYSHNNKTTTTSTVSLNLVTQGEDNNKSYDLYNHNNKTTTTSTATVLT